MLFQALAYASKMHGSAGKPSRVSRHDATLESERLARSMIHHAMIVGKVVDCEI
jgi:hypothetical protein